MKRSLLLKFLCALLLASVLPAKAWQTGPSSSPAVKPSTADAHNWKRYRYDVDGFAVEFPAEPKATANDSKTGTRYVVGLDNGNLAYLVEAAALPANLNKSSQQVLDDYVDGAAKGTKSQVKYSSAITLHGNPGREFTLENDTLILRFNIYLVQKTLYQVLVVATKELAATTEAARFQNSFELL